MPEYQDIYDIHRNLTGKKVIRGGKAFRRGIYPRDSCIIV